MLGGVLGGATISTISTNISFVKLGDFNYRSTAGWEVTAIPFFASIVAALYIKYKTPQWTDEHLLNKDTERTTGQNLITIANRTFIPYPFGVATGEYCNHLMEEAEED